MAISTHNYIPTLRPKTRLIYGVGSIAYGIKDLAFRTYLLLYYNQVLGVSAGLVSAAIMVALVVDAFSDPVVGQFSDSLRTRWGRRHPLMYFSAIPAAVCFLLLWTPPEGLSETGLFIYLVVVACLVRTFITLYEIPSSALAPELTSEYDERTSIASFRYFFGTAGGIVMSFLALLVFLKPTEEYPIGQLNPEGYATFGLVCAIVMFITVMISTAGTHHRIPYLKKAESESLGFRATLQHMKISFSHPSFLAILGFGILIYTGIGMTGALTLYFGTFFWEFSSKELAVLALDGLLAAALAVVLAPAVSRRWGKRNSAICLTIIVVVTTSTPYLLRFAGLFFDNESPWLLPALFTFTAIYTSCGLSSAMLVHAMIGDLVDESSLRTGRHAAGLFYSANSFMQKCVSGMGVFMAGMLIAVVGIPPGGKAGAVTPEMINSLAMIYVPIVAVLYTAGALCLRFYRISRESHENTLQLLKERDAVQAY